MKREQAIKSIMTRKGRCWAHYYAMIEAGSIRFHSKAIVREIREAFKAKIV